MSSERSSSAPPDPQILQRPHFLLNGAENRSPSEAPTAHPLSRETASARVSTSLDRMATLQKSGPTVVKTRSGSVLTRGCILMSDFWPSGRALDLDLNVHGAPNFRAPRQTSLNVFGAAQPRTQGLRAILSILQCQPGFDNHVVWFSTREEPVVYISGRPFVLRDAAQPRRTLALSDRAENLEAIELRLKADILKEATKFGGLVLTHNEAASEVGEGAILPTWTAVDNNNVKTSRELYNYMKASGWNVDYHRIPISPDRPIEDNYLDAYVRVIKETDPSTSSLVFSCGMGAVRTTFAMVAAQIVRRKQMLVQGLPDPYPSKNSPLSNIKTGSPQVENRIILTLEQANAQQEFSASLLRLTYLLQENLSDKHSQSAIELLMNQPTLLENLRKAYAGNYDVILSLLGCLDDGLRSKKLVDQVIDANSHVLNLREEILVYRLKYSMATVGESDTDSEAYLNKAAKALEKYFFMIAFANYVESQPCFEQSFSEWLDARTEIMNQILYLRTARASRLSTFAPINDLSALSKTGQESRSLKAGTRNNVAISGGSLGGQEYSDHVVKTRSGIILRENMLLKSDQWLRESQAVDHGIRGAINFRNIEGTPIYALGQPTIEAIDEVIMRVKEANPTATKIVWITLREEPIVYVNGAPYCLRREGYSLRNMKDFGGISASRLEIIEERLRDDVISEVNAFGGRLLLHTETSDGRVVPVWEEVDSEDVVVVKDIMTSRKTHYGLDLGYARVPITAERPPDFSDLSELIELVLGNTPNTPIIVNCMLGKGRSTLTTVLLLLIRQWLDIHRDAPPTKPFSAMRSYSTRTLAESHSRPKRQSYQVINNLLRVIRKGPRVKSTVDDAIDDAAAIHNLRNVIEQSRVAAEQTKDEKLRRTHAHKGLQALRRYFSLIIFQWYLQSIRPDTLSSFESIETFVKNRPVIKTFEKELLVDRLDALKPLETTDTTESTADPDEVDAIVLNRTGSILSASTILKSDFFSNLQKMTLEERIEGSPNFRCVPLTLKVVPSEGSEEVDFVHSRIKETGKMAVGSGMPTAEGLRRALERLDAGPNGSNTVFWTSLREEPVIYIAGRPHVLRLVDRPLENVEATGITTSVVEAMETSFKKDVLREVHLSGGRLLLHDEVEERPGVFSIIPIWETVTDGDIMTPRDVFEKVKHEGYKLDYGRVAITDEQAPLPDALQQLFERVQAGLASPALQKCFTYNCQMGRGRTTTGMVSACLIATVSTWSTSAVAAVIEPEEGKQSFDSIDGPSEEEAYIQGEYKTILHLVGVLSHGKTAKRMTDRAIDLMQDVQNLRKAIYDYKLKVNACQKGSSKERHLSSIAVNYLYRYGTLISFANYLLEMRETSDMTTKFPEWLHARREITKILERRSLD